VIFIARMMKIKLILPILIILLVSSASLAADYTWFSAATTTWKNSRRSEFLGGQLPTAILDSLDKIYEKSPHQYIVYELGAKRYVQVRCTFDLYEIQGDKLVNKYRYFNRGYTCGGNSFVRDSTHHILGGHGFWTNHLDLLAFDELHGSWELVPTKNQPIDYFSANVYQNSKGIFSLLGGLYNQRKDLDVKNSQGYFLDWETKEWKELELQIEGLDLNNLFEKGGLYFIQTQDYAFWVSTNGLNNIGWNLIEKETGKIFFYDSKNVDMALGNYLEIVGNVLTYPAPSGEQKTLDLDEIRKQSKEVGFVRVKDVKSVGENYTWGYLLLIAVVIFGWVVVKRVSSNRKKELVEAPLLRRKDPLELLLTYSGQLLTTEALDQLLGIDNQSNFDSRRMKRARLIKDINEKYFDQAGKELIVRDKKPEDKRYVFYKIQA
jgi:hypothetical protein